MTNEDYLNKLAKFNAAVQEELHQLQSRLRVALHHTNWSTVSSNVVECSKAITEHFNEAKVPAPADAAQPTPVGNDDESVHATGTEHEESEETQQDVTADPGSDEV